MHRTVTRKSASANRLRISICHRNFWQEPGGMVDPLKIFLLNSFITTQNLVAVRHTEWDKKGIRSQKNSQCWDPTPRLPS